MILSPADFWQQRVEKFRDDSNVLDTILNYRSTQKGRSGLAEILLGMDVRDTGFKRFPLKARPRVVSYAVTFVLQTFDSRLVTYFENLKFRYIYMYNCLTDIYLD